MHKVLIISYHAHHYKMNLPTGLGLSVFLDLAGNGGSNAFGTFGSNVFCGGACCIGC